MTSTELAEQQAPPAVVEYSTPASSDLEQFARDLQMAYGIAQRLVTTSFVPDAYRNKPQEAAAAIMAGAELRLKPLAALRSLDVIQGTPAMRAIALRALVQSHGHEIWVEESNATRAIVKGRRRDSAREQQSVWTLDRARGLGLLGKSNWKQQPDAMLVARATGECARLIDADGILGIAYTTEELLDGVAETSEPEAAPPVKRAPLKRKPLPARPVDEIDPTETTPPTVVPAASPAEPAVDAPTVERDPAEPSDEEWERIEREAQQGAESDDSDGGDSRG